MATTESPFLYYFTSLPVWQMFITGLLTFVVVKSIFGVIRFWRYHKYFNSMPGETDFHWIYGNLHKLKRLNSEDTIVYLDELTSKYPKFRRVWFGAISPTVMCVHHETVRKILKTSEPKPRGLGTVYVSGIDWLGEGLLISNGPKWARNRRLLTPAFHFDILQPYIQVKNEAADILLDKIKNCVKLEKSFELFDYISLYTLDVLLRCAFSYNGDIQRLGQRHPYIKAINELADAWVHRSLRPYLFPNFIFYLTERGKHFSKNCKFVHEFAEDIITKRRHELATDFTTSNPRAATGAANPRAAACGNSANNEQIVVVVDEDEDSDHRASSTSTTRTPSNSTQMSQDDRRVVVLQSQSTDINEELRKEGTAPDAKEKRKYLDFLDILLKARDENDEGLSPLDIRNETDTFLFEGHDTTTSALSWLMYALATHPEYQRKVQEEIDEIYAGKNSDYITSDDLPKMEYLTMCLKEGLRLYSPVRLIQREITKPLELDGFTIPPGTCITIQINDLHHNKLIWEDPDKFCPERFTPENVKNRDTFAFVPFSAGPRNCIGQNFAMHEMKVLLARILHKYTLEVDPSVPVLRKLSVVTKSENGIHVFARPRNQSTK